MTVDHQTPIESPHNVLYGGGDRVIGEIPPTDPPDPTFNRVLWLGVVDPTNGMQRIWQYTNNFGIDYDFIDTTNNEVRGTIAEVNARGSVEYDLIVMAAASLGNTDSENDVLPERLMNITWRDDLADGSWHGTLLTTYTGVGDFERDLFDDNDLEIDIDTTLYYMHPGSAFELHTTYFTRRVLNGLTRVYPPQFTVNYNRVNNPGPVFLPLGGTRIVRGLPLWEIEQGPYLWSKPNDNIPPNPFNVTQVTQSFVIDAYATSGDTKIVVQNYPQRIISSVLLSVGNPRDDFYCPELTVDMGLNWIGGVYVD